MVIKVVETVLGKSDSPESPDLLSEIRAANLLEIKSGRGVDKLAPQHSRQKVACLFLYTVPNTPSVLSKNYHCGN